MSPLPRVTLKPGKEIPVLAGHPWIFSDALKQDVETEAGALVQIETANGTVIGIGTHNHHTSIRVRILSRNAEEKIDADFFETRLRALDAWKQDHLPKHTTGYRVVHAEADNLPGLIMDRYNDTIVFQLHTAGMDRLREEIIEAINHVFKPKNIVERSDLDVRKIEGLTDQPVTTHKGEITDPIEFKEDGITFLADVLHGQKTGFFLDQRDARMAVGELAKGKRVLNLFSYTGAFSIHAAKNKADFVATIDASHPALEIAQKQFAINKLETEDETKALFLEADVLELIQDKNLPGAPYDLIICDPPAFAKSVHQLDRAVKAYTDLNAACLRQLSPGGILVTSSCSGRLDPEAFRSLLRISAGRAKRDVRVLRWITQPSDHAERLAFPEGRYLKTAILEVTAVLE